MKVDVLKNQKIRAMQQNYIAMMEALKNGSATAAQQTAAYAKILNQVASHKREMREAERDRRDTYAQGRADEQSESRGEPYGTY